MHATLSQVQVTESQFWELHSVLTPAIFKCFRMAKVEFCPSEPTLHETASYLLPFWNKFLELRNNPSSGLGDLKVWESRKGAFSPQLTWLCTSTVILDQKLGKTQKYTPQICSTVLWTLDSGWVCLTYCQCGKSLSCCVPWFSHLQNGDYNSTYCIGLLWALGKWIYVISAKTVSGT